MLHAPRLSPCSPTVASSLPVMDGCADPLMMPRIQVDTGAIKFILGGATIMVGAVRGGAVLGCAAFKATW